MSRPKGSKNVDVSSFNKELIQNEIRKANSNKFEVKQEERFIHGIKEEIQKEVMRDMPYLIIEENNKNDLRLSVANCKNTLGYVEQGGVSVTNYRGLDGNIVMVYCQAMVRKE